MITNARLEDILAKWPGLRPKDQFDQDRLLCWNWGTWWTSRRDVGPVLVEDNMAHALIFRAMVEALPREASLLRPWANQDGWRVTSDYAYRDKDILKTYPTAFEALCAYWEEIQADGP